MSIIENPSPEDVSAEDRERLERYLAWKQAHGKQQPTPRRHSLPYVAGMVAVGSVAVALAAWATVASRETKPRVAAGPMRAPAQDVIARSGESAPAFTSTGPGAGESSPVGVSDTVPGVPGTAPAPPVPDVAVADTVSATESPSALPPNPGVGVSNGMRASGAPAGERPAVRPSESASTQPAANEPSVRQRVRRTDDTPGLPRRLPSRPRPVTPDPGLPTDTVVSAQPSSPRPAVPSSAAGPPAAPAAPSPAPSPAPRAWIGSAPAPATPATPGANAQESPTLSRSTIDVARTPSSGAGLPSSVASRSVGSTPAPVVSTPAPIATAPARVAPETVPTTPPTASTSQRVEPAPSVARTPATVPTGSNPDGTRHDRTAAIAPGTASSPPASSAAVTRMSDSVSQQWSETVATVQRFVNFMPEVRLGKALVRWVKSQPPVEPGSESQPAERPETR